MTTYWLDKSDKKEDQKVYNGVTKWTNTLQILHKQIRCKQSDLKSTKVIAIILKKTLINILSCRCEIEKNKENSLRSDEGKSDWEQSKETLLEVRFYLKGY